VLTDLRKHFFPTISADGGTIETSVLFEVFNTARELNLCHMGPRVLEEIPVPQR
jgi:hypothetical protein